MNRFIANLSWFGVGGGALVPGFLFFTSFSPPLFPGISIVISALATAIIFSVYSYKSKERNDKSRGLPKYVRIGILLLGIAIILIILYVITFQAWTILEPQKNEIRFQIGFGKAEWSLTEGIGKDLKKEFPYGPVTEWALNERAFDQERVELIWKPWTIYFAGVLLILIYFSSFILWTIGFALMAKHASFLSDRLNN
jgi:hypothetical protein